MRNKIFVTELGVVAFPAPVVVPAGSAPAADLQLLCASKRVQALPVIPGESDRCFRETTPRSYTGAASEITPYRHGGINE